METMINLIPDIFMVSGLLFWIEDAGDNYVRSLKYNYKQEFYSSEYLFVGLVLTYWICVFLQAFSQDIR